MDLEKQINSLKEALAAKESDYDKVSDKNIYIKLNHAKTVCMYLPSKGNLH